MKKGKDYTFANVQFIKTDEVMPSFTECLFLYVNEPETYIEI